jgi:hypothetical protein
MASEGDHVVALVERELGEEAPRGAVGPEHGKLHTAVPFESQLPRVGRGGIERTRTAPAV